MMTGQSRLKTIPDAIMPRLASHIHIPIAMTIRPQIIVRITRASFACPRSILISAF
jgi:hypothetical protein